MADIKLELTIDETNQVLAGKESKLI